MHDREEVGFVRTRANPRPLVSSLLIAMVSLSASNLAPGQVTVKPKAMPEIARVDARFVSYNVEAVEVTGGQFWKPFGPELEALMAAASQAKHASGQAPTMDRNLYFQYRKPIDLRNPRLQNLAAALAPAYIRVSGTWRNSVYFQDNDEPPMSTPPKGFNSVLTRTQWKGVIDFAHATGSEIVASVTTSAGTRDSKGLWTSDQAKAFFDFTKRAGGHITATEFMNEPTYAEYGGAPHGYDAAAFAKDVTVFKQFLRSESPTTVLLGPGGVGEAVPTLEGAPAQRIIHSEDIMKATGPVFDVFSYHVYGTVSRRCATALGPNAGMSPEKALTVAWLNKGKVVEQFYAKMRDAYLPGKPLWLTESGEASCGGDRWAAEFIDSFRYMDQLGSLAQKGVQTVMQNTLASSDYGLLDEDTFSPRPNYWAALLWKRTMGTRVLDPSIPSDPALRIYAQCMKGTRGGVSILVLNVDRTTEQELRIPIAGERYTLSAPDLLGKTVFLNGAELAVGEDGTLPKIAGQPIKAGDVHFAPLTITFIVLPTTRNANCM
jgi:hypothetical protein